MAYQRVHSVIQLSKKTLFKNEEYSIALFEDRILVFKSNEIDLPQYILPFNVENLLYWKCDEKQKKLKAFGISIKNKISWFYGDSQALHQFKQSIGSRAFHADICSFWESVTALGCGTSSQVYKIKNNFNPNQTCAVKCISKEYINKSLDNLEHNKERMDRLIQEIEIMKIVDHPNIIKLHEIYEGDGAYYLVLELLAGPPLDRFVRHQTENIPEETIKLIMKQLLHGIAYLHSKDIVHRDIKLENLVFSNEEDFENLKILDFGLATFVDNGTLTSVCGTPGYVAPEIFFFQEYNLVTDMILGYSFPVDIYSAGVVFYRLMARNHLFTGENTEEVLQKNRLSYYDIQSMKKLPYSHDAIDLLLKMLERQPEKRITARNALCHPFIGEPKDYTYNSVKNFSSISLDSFSPIPMEPRQNQFLPKLETDRDFMFIIDEDCRETIKNSQIDQDEDNDDMMKQFFENNQTSKGQKKKNLQMKTSKSNLNLVHLNERNPQIKHVISDVNLYERDDLQQQKTTNQISISNLK